MSLRSRVIKIGNSRGIRIPAAVLEQLHMEGDVDLEVEGDHLIVRPRTRHPRAGWEEAFQRMAAAGDDRLLDPDLPPNSWDEQEWDW